MGANICVVETRESTGYLLIPQTIDAATWIVYQFSPNKNLC